MFDSGLAKRASENLNAARMKKPLIHSITNYVVMNFTANALLACGVSPVMAHAHEEVEEMVSLAGALVLNIGTLTPQVVESMLKAGKRAEQLNIPIVLDPVGSGATKLRTDSAKRLLSELPIKIVRGNASEVMSLSSKGSKTKGVDAVHSVDEATDEGVALAGELDTTIAITGEVDLVTDGMRMLYGHNGHALMRAVTGTGCAATALIGAFAVVDPDPVAAASTALAYFGVAGETAAQSTQAPGSFQIALLDALYNMDARALAEGTRIESSLRKRITRSRRRS